MAIHSPASADELAALVKAAAGAGHRVKAVGSGHSFTDIACTDGVLVRLDRMDRVLAADTGTGRVTVEAGITLAALGERLAGMGLALPNLGDIAYQTVAGAISTATHGTGVRLGNLATQVVGLELVAGDGSLVRCSDDDDPELLRAARVGLGALGVLTSVTLQCVPAFNLYAVEEPRRLDDLLAGGELDRLAEGNDHFEFFWFPHTEWCITKRNNVTDEPARPRTRWKEWRDDVWYSNVRYELMCRRGRARPERIPALMQQVASGLGRVRVVDRSDRVFASPRLVRFNEMEYAVPREAAAAVLARVRQVVDSGFLVNFPVEVRFVAADDALLSPSYGRDTVYVAVHLYRGMDHEPFFRAVEEVMVDVEGRPHWGKLHWRTAADLAPAYPEWERFAEARRCLDPEGRFANAYLERVLGPSS